MARPFAELKVKMKHPGAVCITDGKPAFQIWDCLFAWCGEKLGEGNTETEAWKNAAKKLA